MIKEITIPEIGEKVESGKVVGVLVKQGDMVDHDDGIIEFETEKAVVEIPSPEKGRITEILVHLGDELKIGAVIARLDTEPQAGAGEKQKVERVTGSLRPVQPMAAEATTVDDRIERRRAEREVAAATDEESERGQEVEQEVEERPAPSATRPEPAVAKAPPRSGPAPASPSVRRLARELGVDINDVPGSGPGGRISDEDVKNFVKRGKTPSTPAAKAAARPSRPASAGRPGLPDFSRWGEVERTQLSTVRRITAESTTVSWTTIPHVTQFDKSDITHLQGFIERHSKRVEQAGGKLTVTAVLLKVIAEALKKFPRFNSSIDLDSDQIIYKKYIHIGLAVDTNRGLLVPVVRDVDTKSIVDLAVEVVDLADRARNKKVTPDDLEGGTFTVSNQGGIGGTDFTPIVLWPQVAILGVSRASVEPKYISGEFKPRTILPLSLSYDHRVIDGADAARFLRWVCESLENPFAMYMD